MIIDIMFTMSGGFPGTEYILTKVVFVFVFFFL